MSGETWGPEMVKEVYLQMYKIIFGHCDVDPHMFFDFNVFAKTRRNHNFNIRPNRTPTNYDNFHFSIAT